MDLKRFEVITFDCYGTLIDWETGIWEAVRPVLANHGVTLAKDAVLELYGAIESRVQSGPFQSYRSVLRAVMEGLGAELHFTPTPDEAIAIASSLGDWPAFADTVPALASLRHRHKLAVISNVDDDLFAASARHFHMRFDWVITAQQVKSYKPSTNNFRKALERIGVPPERVLHVAQSVFHDIVPAKAMGLATVWVNRRHDKAGSGATPAADAKPDLEVPDLRTLASMIAAP